MKELHFTTAQVRSVSKGIPLSWERCMNLAKDWLILEAEVKHLKAEVEHLKTLIRNQED